MCVLHVGVWNSKHKLSLVALWTPIWNSSESNSLRVDGNSRISSNNINRNDIKSLSHTNKNTSLVSFTLSKNESEYLAVESVSTTSRRTPRCDRNQIIHGHWEAVQWERPPYVTQTEHLRCYPKAYYYKKEPWDTWEWKPDDASRRKCKLSNFDPTDFCKIMGGATISIVGDSLSWEQYSSLVQLHGVRTRQGYQHQSRELHMNIQQPVCDGRTRIVYRRDDKLQNVTGSIIETFPTVLVLNRGAHYVNDTLLLPDIRHNIAEVREWLRLCREVYEIKCHFFWRTSVPGHPECGNFTAPVNNIDVMETRVRDLSFYNERSINYHWYDYQHQNELVLSELQASGIEYRVIDAYHLNMRRPDEHRAHQGDCLHNCYPGKMDVYNQLLLHYLLMDRTRDDAKQNQLVARRNDWPLDKATRYTPKATEEARAIRMKLGRHET